MATELISELLDRGLDDWIQLAEVVSLVHPSVGALQSDAQVKDATLEMVRHMVEHGLVHVGDVTADGFVPWGLGRDETIERIRQRWNDLPGSPGLGEVCWLANTTEGDARAHRLNTSADTPDPSP
jgi:hypothetical protein